MSDASPITFLRDDRFAAYATAPAPAWLWSADAARVLWTNAIGAALLGAPRVEDLTRQAFAPHARAAMHVARLAASLPATGAPRLERMRGFGTGFLRPLTCACSRITLADGTQAILIAATEAAGPTLRLSERARRLIEDGEQAIAAFAPDGTLLHANPSAVRRMAHARTLTAFDASTLAAEALSSGSSAGRTLVGATSFQRVGREADTILIAIFGAQPEPASAPPVTEPPARPDSDRAARMALDAIPAAAAAPAPPPSSEPPVQAVTPAPTSASAPMTDVTSTVPPPPAPRAPIVTEVASTPSPQPPSVPRAPTETMAVRPEPRQHPLRFVWQMDAESRFTIASDEFIKIVGAASAALMGKPWDEINAALAVDAGRQVARAISTRDTWSGVTVSWPVDGAAECLAVELSGLPIYDRQRTFTGYRGFGVCRDVELLDLLATRPRTAAPAATPTPPPVLPTSPTLAPEAPAAPEPQPAAHAPERDAPGVTQPKPAEPQAPATAPPEPIAATPAAPSPEPPATPAAATPPPPQAPEPPPVTRTPPTLRPLEPERHTITFIGPAQNVVPFRVATSPDPRAPGLSAGERNAFTEIARQLSARLKTPERSAPASQEAPALRTMPGAGIDGRAPAPADDAPAAPQDGARATPAIPDAPVRTATVEAGQTAVAVAPESKPVTIPAPDTAATRAAAQPSDDDAAARWLAEGSDARALLDRLPLGVLVYRFETPFYASRSFLERVGYGSLAAFSEAGGIDSLFIETSGTAGDNGDQALTITTAEGDKIPVEGRLFSIPWNGETATALVLTDRRPESEADVKPEPKAAREEAAKPALVAARSEDLARISELERELASARRQADVAAKDRTELLGKIGQEVRTPLMSIIGFVETMLHERFGPIGNERYRTYLTDMLYSGSRIVSIFDDLASLSKIGGGKVDPTGPSINLNEIVQACVAQMQTEASRVRVLIRSSLANPLPNAVAEPESARQVVLSLLANSIKFAGAGGQVIVSTAVNGGNVALRLRDTGTGLSANDLAKLQSGGGDASADPAGQKLTLAVARTLLEANRASLSVTSKADEGTLVEAQFVAARS